jgi:serine protease AprX
MKKIGNLYCFKIVSFLFFFIINGYNSFAQTESKKIIEPQNKEVVETLQKQLSSFDKKQQAAVDRFVKLGYKPYIEQKNGESSQLMGENEFGKPLYFVTSNNQEVVNGLKANALYSAGFDLGPIEGQGIRIGLIDEGSPRTSHEMFRLSLPSYTSPLLTRVVYEPVVGDAIFGTVVKRHATHIAGTIMGNQFSPSSSSPNNSLVRGVAYKSTLKSWHWKNPTTKMLITATDAINIVNISFGINPLNMPDAGFGRYNVYAKQSDSIMCAFKNFQIVKSVGNTRDDPRTLVPQVDVLGGYDLLEGIGISKNALVVGSVNLTNSVMNSNGKYNWYTEGAIIEPYSSWGSTDDGRIKPDLVTHGNNVRSCIDTQNNYYGNFENSLVSYSGTSSAAAGISGGIALLHNYWNLKFAPTMWSSTVRALLIHSIDEIGERGPDYRNGWGVANLQKAANTITERGKSVIIREDVYNGQTVRLNLAATGKEDLKVTIAWTDPAGTVTFVDVNNPNASINETTAKLVNDLDIRLIRKDANGNDDITLVDPTLNSASNNVLFPWILKQNIHDNNTPIALAEKAQRGINDRDNIEKIEVYKDLIPSTGGMFQLQITHKGTLVDACQTGQPYSLIISGVSFCNDDLVFLQHQDDELADNVKTTVLAHTIKASNVIRAITPFPVTDIDLVEYKAADFIELLPQSQNGGSGTEGFTAEYGSDFYAHIECTGINNRVAFSPIDIESFKNDTTVNQNVTVEKGEVVIFPNPYINDILNIQFRLINASTFEIQIYDITGKLVYQDTDKEVYSDGVHKKAIDANFLPSGTFIIKTISSDGISTLKLIKK